MALLLDRCTSRSDDVDLAPYRDRIRIVRAWRLAPAYGSAGLIAAIAAIAGDYCGLWDAPPRLLAGLVGGAIAAGTIAGFLERYDDARVARAIDRRSALDDRLTTAFEIGAHTTFAAAVRTDAAVHIAEHSPSQVFPFKLTRAHAAFAALFLLAALAYLAADTILLLPPRARDEAKKLARAGQQVEVIAKPVVAEAGRPEATTQDKQLAHALQKFARDLQKGRLTKQQALIKANELAEQARAVESRRSSALSQAAASAEDAGEKLSQLSAAMSGPIGAQSALAQKASSLEQQIATLQQALVTAKANRSAVGQSKIDALQKQLDALQKELAQVKLSQQAQELMDKLAANPQFQEAQQLMAKLEQQSGQSADSQSSELTQQQLKAMADRLEELAKELNTDAKLRDYADRVLQAAKSARLGNPPTAKEMLQAFGLDQDQNPQFGLYGKGGTSPGVWEGCLGHLLHTDKSSLLHVKVNDRIITSQLGKSGPESYQEFLGPSRLTPQSGIPYQAVMPKYEKSAESALSRGDVPPQMRATVRDYFESLRQ